MNKIELELYAALKAQHIPSPAPKQKRKAKEIRAANKARRHIVGKAMKCSEPTYREPMWANHSRKGEK